MLKNVSRRKFLKYMGASAAVAGSLSAATKVIGQTKTSTKRSIPTTPIKIGEISFLSGASAAPFGIPAHNAYKMLTDVINKEGGILGRKIDLLSTDEAGGPDAQVKIARKLVLDDKVDVILGFISSADALAAIPLSDETGGLIVVYDGATYKLLEGDKSPFNFPKYKLGFRTGAHLSADNIGAALMIKKYLPNIKTYATINPDYAWGRDCGEVFGLLMKKLMPQVKLVKALWPPLFTTDYTAHVSALMAEKPDVVHTSLWGGDVVTFTKQALGMGFFKKTKVAYVRGDPVPQEVGKDFPEEQIICCTGPHYFLYPPHDRWPLNKWFVEEYFKRYGKYPAYPCYHAYQGMYVYKHAVEKAAALVGGWPELDEIAKAMEGLSIQTPSGHLRIGKDHDAVEDYLVGFTKSVPGYPFPILDQKRMEIFPGHMVHPPEGIRTVDWINSWKA